MTGCTRTLGIVGGIAPPSTIDYYRRLVSRYRERSGGGYPSIVIDSIDARQFLRLVGDGPRESLVDYLLGELGRLSRAGADLALFASNTPHVVFDEVAAQSPIPLISIVEETAAAAERAGFQRLGLIGARITMERGFYPRVFARRGMSVVVPAADDRDYIDRCYFTELVESAFRKETRSGISAAIDRMARGDGIEAVILGGTELPLLFRDTDLPRLPALDTTAIHVESAVDRLLS